MKNLLFPVAAFLALGLLVACGGPLSESDFTNRVLGELAASPGFEKGHLFGPLTAEYFLDGHRRMLFLNAAYRQYLAGGDLDEILKRQAALGLLKSNREPFDSSQVMPNVRSLDWVAPNNDAQGKTAEEVAKLVPIRFDTLAVGNYLSQPFTTDYKKLENGVLLIDFDIDRNSSLVTSPEKLNEIRKDLDDDYYVGVPNRATLLVLRRRDGEKGLPTLRELIQQAYGKAGNPVSSRVYEVENGRLRLMRDQP